MCHTKTVVKMKLPIRTTLFFILTSMLIIIPFIIWVMQGYFSSVSKSFEEAAMIDGCSNAKMFFYIMLPMSMPMVAVIMLYYAVEHWNSYFNALIYLSRAELYPLQLYLRNILLQDMMLDMLGGDSEAMEAMIRRLQLKESMQYGIVVVSSLPILILYPFLQKFFAKGLMMGAIKG